MMLRSHQTMYLLLVCECGCGVHARHGALQRSEDPVARNKCLHPQTHRHALQLSLLSQIPIVCLWTVTYAAQKILSLVTVTLCCWPVVCSNDLSQKNVGNTPSLSIHGSLARVQEKVWNPHLRNMLQGSEEAGLLVSPESRKPCQESVCSCFFYSLSVYVDFCKTVLRKC